MSNVDYLSVFKQRRGANIGWSKTCCWIDGERPYGDDPFCGEPSKPNSSYCEHHHGRAWRKPDKPRKDGFTFGNGMAK